MYGKTRTVCYSRCPVAVRSMSSSCFLSMHPFADDWRILYTSPVSRVYTLQGHMWVRDPFRKAIGCILLEHHSLQKEDHQPTQHPDPRVTDSPLLYLSCGNALTNAGVRLWPACWPGTAACTELSSTHNMSTWPAARSATACSLFNMQS